MKYHEKLAREARTMSSDQYGGRSGRNPAPKTPEPAAGGVDSRSRRAREAGAEAGRASYPCDSCPWPRRPISGTSVCEADELCWDAHEKARREVLNEAREVRRAGGSRSDRPDERHVKEGASANRPPLAEPPEIEDPPAPASYERGKRRSPKPQPRTPDRAEDFPGAPFREGCEACGASTEFKIAGVAVCSGHQDIVIECVRAGRDLPWRKLRVRRS